MKILNTLKNLLATERTHLTCSPEPTYQALRDYLNPYGDSFEKAELELTSTIELRLSRAQSLELEDPAVLADRQINFYMPEYDVESYLDNRSEEKVLADEFGFDDVEEMERWADEKDQYMLYDQIRRLDNPKYWDYHLWACLDDYLDAVYEWCDEQYIYHIDDVQPVKCCRMQRLYF